MKRKLAIIRGNELAIVLINLRKMKIEFNLCPFLYVFWNTKKLKKTYFWFDLNKINAILIFFGYLNLLLCLHLSFLIKWPKNDSKEFIEFGILSSFKKNIIWQFFFNSEKWFCNHFMRLPISTCFKIIWFLINKITIGFFPLNELNNLLFTFVFGIYRMAREFARTGEAILKAICFNSKPDFFWDFK